MAHRPDPAHFDKPLSAAELSDLHRTLSLLSPHHVVKSYREAYERCRMSGELLPKASAIQELVTAWKVLWHWKRSRRERSD